MSHFEGKSVANHLKAARLKGALATAEVHGAEMPGHIAAAIESCRDTAVILFLLWIVFPQKVAVFMFVAAGILIWKTGRSALLGWSRLERLHRLIEEERWEIEHHRDQEREELTALYQAKGLSGKLLDEVISILMADDNRLLRIMLEEELGLTLEAFEHPLKQSVGAALGVIIAAALFFFLPPLVATPFIILATALASAKIERNRPIEAIIWNVSLVALAGAATYFLKQIFAP